jgi:hypothetical protein
LSQRDCGDLETIFLETDDPIVLEESLTLIRKCCKISSDVLKKCVRLVMETPIPGVTSIAMKIIQGENRADSISRQLYNLLDYSKYEIWYDEVHIAIGIYVDTANDFIKSLLHDRITNLLHDADKAKDHDLISFAISRGIPIN